MTVSASKRHPWWRLRAEGQGQVVNSELCAGNTWRLLDGSKTLGLGQCQPLLCNFAPLGLGRTDLPFLPKEDPAAIWLYLQLGWSLGGTQRKAAKCACRGPLEAAALLSHPRLQRLPQCAARSAHCSPTRDWLSPSWGDRWRLYVLGPLPPLCLPDAHQDLPAPVPTNQTRLSKSCP